MIAVNASRTARREMRVRSPGFRRERVSEDARYDVGVRLLDSYGMPLGGYGAPGKLEPPDEQRIED